MTLVRAAAVAMLAALLACPALSAPAEGGPSGEIVNGKPVPAGSYPFMVSLQNPNSKAANAYGNHFCGGTLLDATHVLTAAHCVWTGVKAVVPTKVRVLAGAGRLRERARREGVLLTVEHVAVHPKYFKSEAYDVAVITLKRPAPMTTFVTLPAAADAAADAPGTVATVAGWGSTRRYGGSGGDRTKYPRQLMETTVPIVGNGVCDRDYQRLGVRNLNLRVQVCAGGKHRDSCYGDSGGPLFTGSGAAPVQIGIVSWGAGCGETRNPGIYTRLTNPGIASFIQQELQR